MPNHIDTALAHHTRRLALQDVEERLGCLMESRMLPIYDQTREFGEILRSFGNTPVVLRSEITICIFSKFAEEVVDRPDESSRRFVLPAGMVIRKETIDRQRRIVARSRCGRILVLTVPKARDPEIRLVSHCGFIKPSGRGARHRGGTPTGPAMDTSAGR